MTQEVWVMPTMDCEPPKHTVTEHANQKSQTSPTAWDQSERAIRGFVDRTHELGLVPTFFIHPEVADAHHDLFRELHDDNVCIGLHLHPYKFRDQYRDDLGAYEAPEQREMLETAKAEWTETIGVEPAYFRSGWYSGNDSTFGILEDLGFRGGSISAPGRTNPDAAVCWVGADPYPHRAHRGFRLLPGDSSFIEVPYLGDFNRPTHDDHYSTDQGYETVYLSADELEGGIHGDTVERDREQVTRNLIDRFIDESAEMPTIVANTHNNMDYSDPDHPASKNLESFAATLIDAADQRDIEIRHGDVGMIIDEFLARN